MMGQSKTFVSSLDAGGFALMVCTLAQMVRILSFPFLGGKLERERERERETKGGDRERETKRVREREKQTLQHV